MIPEKIVALFGFIDYLDSKKVEYIEKYLPICEDVRKLADQRSMLRPESNYIEKQKYDSVQKEIADKFQPIQENIYKPFLNKLRELQIWAGDDVFTSIWNNNSSAIFNFKKEFEVDDVETVMTYKNKYLSFRRETNSNFLCLQFALNNLDEIYKALFDFFKDSSENEFESFEAKTIEAHSIEDAVKRLTNKQSENVKFSLPQNSLLAYQNLRQYYPELYQKSHTIKNEIFMGHKIQVGDITGHGNVLNTGNGANINTSASVSKGDLDTLKQQFAKYGIEDEDIEEISDIVQTELPNPGNGTLGEKSHGWILKIASKALSGVGKIATNVSSNILANIIRQYYGI